MATNQYLKLAEKKALWKQQANENIAKVLAKRYKDRCDGYFQTKQST